MTILQYLYKNFPHSIPNTLLAPSRFSKNPRQILELFTFVCRCFSPCAFWVPVWVSVCACVSMSLPQKMRC